MGLPVKKGSLTFAIFVLFFALCISAVAAYYSIVGLMAIFSGAALAIAVMGGVLEVGKLVAASWLYNNWKRAPVLMKSYLTMGVLVLMFITSMGIFGFLSKAHLEQVGPTGNHEAKIEQYDFQIEQQEKRIDRANHVLGQFDKALAEYFERGYVTRGLKERAKQTKERETLQAEIADANAKIDELSSKKFESKKEIRGIEAEVGPIKYIAELVYEDSAEKHLDKAVRWMIILLIFVFDPLAVLLVIAGNMSIAFAREERQQNKKEPDVEIEPIPVEIELPEVMGNTAEIVVDHLKEPVTEQATDPNGTPLPIPIEIETPTYVCNIEDTIDDVFKNASTGFNLAGPEATKLKRQLVKALRKNKG